MTPWSTNPCWQYFSSLYREVVTAKEAPNEIRKCHHLISSLYFGIASLEAFINQKMRMHLSKGKDDDHIFKVLRYGRIMDKLDKWPKEILSETPSLSAETIGMLRVFNEIRGDLTHPNKDVYDFYKRLEMVDPDTVLVAVVEYIVRFYEVEGEVFPYWLFGWNYLNPRPHTNEIIVISNKQFLHSLLSMGFRVPAYEAGAADQWKEKHMSSFAGYLEIKKAIESMVHCEPKNDRFPFEPTLCKRWWTKEHHRSCGNVTKEARQYCCA